MRYIAKNNFIISEAAGDTVLIPLTDSVAKMGSMLVLNETGVFILEHIKEETTVDQLVAAFTEEYDCPEKEELIADIENFLTTMVGKGFVEKRG